ncbi:tRNA-dihydrouridine(20) synthase [NAD(P)+]-like [Lamellibrachia satsuma]|nr:tRNA-dihydrouridine(20) synthase [NAD(P)+]-like [Lamellibrachia satsuma]
MPKGQDGMEYRNKLVLAPMVRVCTLPMRLLALDYGADIVYCEEIIDFKMLRSKRIENSVLGTIDFVTDDGTLAFRTCTKEKGKVVFQLGTADPQRALQAARLVEKDVAAIDVNMGCPKEFSIRGGMGAALLKQPHKVKEILTTLVQGLSIPVTCKIRLLPTLDDTLALAKLIENTGVSALGLHGRTQHERNRDHNHNDIIKVIAQNVSIPVIANGGSREIKRFDDIAKFREETGTSSVMLARAVQWNPSILRHDGLLPIHDIIKAYLKYAIDYDSVSMNAKYCVQQLLREQLEMPPGKALLAAGSLRQICDIWGMAEYYDEVQLRMAKARTNLKRSLETDDTEQVKKKKLEDGTEVYDLPLKYNRRNYGPKTSPKMILYQVAEPVAITNVQFVQIVKPKGNYKPLPTIVRSVPPRSVRNKTLTINEDIIEQEWDVLVITEMWLKKIGDKVFVAEMTPPGYTFQHVAHASVHGSGVTHINDHSGF